MAWKTWVQPQVELYQRLKKWYLMLPCLTLSIIRYVSRVKWSNPGKGVAPSPTPWWSSYWKGSLLVTLDYGRQLYFMQCPHILIVLYTAGGIENSCLSAFGMQFLFTNAYTNCISFNLFIYLLCSTLQNSSCMATYLSSQKTIQERWIRHARFYWSNKNKLISDILEWTTTHITPVLLDQ